MSKHHLDVCLQLHMVFSLCVWVSGQMSLFYKDSSHIGLGAHPRSVGPHLTDHICNDLVPNRITLWSWGSGLLHTNTQVSSCQLISCPFSILAATSLVWATTPLPWANHTPNSCPAPHSHPLQPLWKPESFGGAFIASTFWLLASAHFSFFHW